MNAKIKMYLMLLLVSLFLCAEALAQVPALYKNTSQKGDVKERYDQTVVRSQNIVVDVAQLRNQQRKTLSAQLFDRKTIILNRETLETQKNALIWKGTIVNQPGSRVTFVIVNNVVIGDIVTSEFKIYQIRYIGNRIHVLREIDQSKFPPEGDPTEPRLRKDETGDTCSSDAPTDIDAMVVYTATTRSAAGGTDAMQATILLAMEETNQSYLNSGITQRLRLAHMAEVSYTESGNSMTDRDRLQNGSDGFMDNVHTLRNTFAADVVMLIVENLENCGRAFIMNSVSNAFEAFGFGVVERSCATGNFSFGHELGHIMSARHDWAADPTNNSPFAFNHGFIDTTPTAPATPWRTVMARNGSPSSTRVQFWSNPNINFPPGDPMGVATGPQRSDNAQTLNTTALTVANFRCSSPGVPNVWMKDTWNDTGIEPNPNTAGEAMWQSPYIWVRNSQDTGLTHQHEHQNPEFGSTNWVYVKLHNGATTTQSGNLELYFANASAGLSWSSDFTLLTSIPVSGFVAGSTRIVEAQWNSLPGTGHYCMIARWVSASDPMATAETSDINANTLNNNNIVWRNLNIVDLTADADQSADLLIRNTSKQRAVLAFTVNSPARRDASSFLGNGQITVTFDDKLYELVRKGFKQQEGVKLKGRTFIITGSRGVIFDNIIVPARYEGKVKLNFRANPTAPKRRYEAVAAQYQTDTKQRRRLVGGVSYLIYNYKR